MGDLSSHTSHFGAAEVLKISAPPSTSHPRARSYLRVNDIKDKRYPSRHAASARPPRARLARPSAPPSWDDTSRSSSHDLALSKVSTGFLSFRARPWDVASWGPGGGGRKEGRTASPLSYRALMCNYPASASRPPGASDKDIQLARPVCSSSPASISCALSFFHHEKPSAFGVLQTRQIDRRPGSWLCACRCAHAPARPELTPHRPAGGGSGGPAPEGWDGWDVSSASRRRRASHVVVYHADESHAVPRTQLHLSEYLLVTRVADATCATRNGRRRAAHQGSRAGLSALVVLV